MDINKEELAALYGLPHIQRLTYVMGIKPYMDYKTYIVGIKRRVSYQSISEELYVEPHQGIKAENFSRAQVRRAVAGLARVGLISIQSDDKHLILKCELASQHFSVQNKAVTNPSSQAVTKASVLNRVNTEDSADKPQKAVIPKTPKADTPLKDNNFLYLLFEKFWESYPQKNSKPEAQAVFEALNPDNNLFQKIIQSLNAQVQHHELMIARGKWVPAWKYPAKWLEKRCWEDEISTDLPQEKHHGMPKHQKNTGKRDTPKSIFWIPDDDDEDDNDGESNVGGNILAFQRT